MSYWQFVEQEWDSYPVELLCQTLAVSPTHYYAWRKQQQSAPA
jgi:hypothetical protein